MKTILPYHIDINHFKPLFSFDTLWKHQKTKFSDVFRRYRKRPAAWNGLIMSLNHIWKQVINFLNYFVEFRVFSYANGQNCNFVDTKWSSFLTNANSSLSQIFSINIFIIHFSSVIWINMYYNISWFFIN